MKVGFLVTARLKSTRLPEKLLREVAGRPILEHMLDRLKLAKRVDEIIVCTSTNPQDDRLIDLATVVGVASFRGDEEDVLKRLHEAANSYNLDYILNITADCPFVDPIYADRIVEAFEETGADLIRAFELPHGAFSYGINPQALEKVIEIKADNHTEVWGRYFTDTDLFQIYDLPIDNPLHRQPDLRLTLDYPEDLDFFKAVFAALYRPGEVFSLDDILLFLKEHPEVVKINRGCVEAFKKRFIRQSEIALKPRYEIKRAAVLGCGSIGQRHIRNLHALGIEDVVALRSRKGHHQVLKPDLAVKEVSNWEELLEIQPDVAIISNPTSLHLQTGLRLIPHVRGLFIEKPLSHSLECVPEFLDEIEYYRTNCFVGYNLQFHPLVREIEALLESDRLGKPLLLQCQVGQWLPSWHPYEDYRQAYYARPELGGGVARTLIHEVHLAQELLGPARQVAGFIPQNDLLDIPVESIADFMIQHASGAISQIHLDYIQRPTQRAGVISCERGWIRYDLVCPQIVMQDGSSKEPMVMWTGEGFDANQPYLEEMRTFLRFTSEGRVRHGYDAWNAARSLAMTMAGLESSKTGCIIPVAE